MMKGHVIANCPHNPFKQNNEGMSDAQAPSDVASIIVSTQGQQAVANASQDDQSTVSELPNTARFPQCSWCYNQAEK